MIRFTATVEGAEVLDRSFNRITEYISDLRPVWPSVAAEFYSIMKEQFDSQGSHGASGTWAPLSPAYKKWKEIHYPGKPILQLTGALIESLTSSSGLDSVFRPEPDQLTIGSKSPYARVHQQSRPPISLTEEDKRRITKAIQLPLVQFVRKQGFQVLESAA